MDTSSLIFSRCMCEYKSITSGVLPFKVLLSESQWCSYHLNQMSHLICLHINMLQQHEKLFYLLQLAFITFTNNGEYIFVLIFTCTYSLGWIQAKSLFHSRKGFVLSTCLWINFQSVFLPLSCNPLYTKLNVTVQELNLGNGLNVSPRTSQPSQPQLLV